MVSELHDTVVRDLTRAVTAAEQARLAQPRNAPLSPELAAMTASVRAAVEQLRGNLRAMSDAGGASGLDVLASSAPRPLAEVVDEARAALARKGVYCEHTTAANYAAYLEYRRLNGPTPDTLLTLCGAGLKSDH